MLLITNDGSVRTASKDARVKVCLFEEDVFIGESSSGPMSHWLTNSVNKTAHAATAQSKIDGPVMGSNQESLPTPSAGLHIINLPSGLRWVIPPLQTDAHNVGKNKVLVHGLFPPRPMTLASTKTMNNEIVDSTKDIIAIVVMDETGEESAWRAGAKFVNVPAREIEIQKPNILSTLWGRLWKFRMYSWAVLISIARGQNGGVLVNDSKPRRNAATLKKGPGWSIMMNC